MDSGRRRLTFNVPNPSPMTANGISLAIPSSAAPSGAANNSFSIFSQLVPSTLHLAPSMLMAPRGAHHNNLNIVAKTTQPTFDHYIPDSKTYADLSIEAKEEAAKPLYFIPLNAIIFYANQHIGLDRPSIRTAIENHVFPFSQVDTLVEKNYFQMPQIRFVQSVDGKIYIGPEGDPGNDIMHHGGLAKLPSLLNSNQLISNNKCINAGYFKYNVIMQTINGKEEFHHIEIFAIVNQSGAMKTHFNQIQLALIEMYSLMKKNPRIRFASNVLFKMAEWKFMLSTQQLTNFSTEEQKEYCANNNINQEDFITHIQALNQYYTIDRDSLITLLEKLTEKYGQTIYAPEKLAEYSMTQRQTVTYTVTENYVEYRTAKKSLEAGVNNSTPTFSAPVTLTDSQEANSIFGSPQQVEREKRKTLAPATPTLPKYNQESLTKKSNSLDTPAPPKRAKLGPAQTPSAPAKPAFAGHYQYSLSSQSSSTATALIQMRETPSQSSSSSTEAIQPFNPAIMQNVIASVQANLDREVLLNREANTWETNLFPPSIFPSPAQDSLQGQSPTTSPSRSVIGSKSN